MYRPVVQEDRFAIFLVASSLDWKSDIKKWTDIVDVDKCMSAMCNHFTEDGIHSVIVKDSYVIVYSVDVPWFSHKPTLNIHLTLRIADNGATFNDVLATYEALAKEYACNHICVGTALAKSDRALEKLYSDGGYQRIGIELHKEV